MTELLGRLLVVFLASGFYALDYWVLRTQWDANPAFAAGLSAVIAILIWGRVSL